MDKDKIKEMLEGDSEDVAEKLAEAFNAEISGLKANKDAILAEKKELSTKVDDLSKKLDKIDFSEYNTLKEKAEKAELMGNGSPEDIADLQLSIKRVETERDAIKAELEAAQSTNNNIKSKLVNGHIVTALTDGFLRAGVSNETLDILKSAYSGRAEAQLKDDGSVDVLMKTPEGGLLPVKDWVDGWAKTPEAKNFIKASVTQGGGAIGSGIAGGKSKKDMTADEATAFAKQHGIAAYKALK